MTHTTIHTPAVSNAVVTAEFLRRIAAIVGPERLLSAADELLVYECDGYVVEKTTPDVVVFPQSSDEVLRIVHECVAARIPFVPRGAGTSLAGGCLPVGGGVMVALTRMNKILD
jgi:glycolate oxidase